MEMVRVGGHFIQVTCGNNFMGHGLYQFSPEFMYRVFSPENGFQTLAILLQEVRATSEGWRGPWFLALDPKKIGWRIEFRNSRPTYIIVIAQRKADAPIFAAPPQQSDYQTAWEASTDATASQSPAKSALRLYGASSPRLLRGWCAHLTIHTASSGSTKTTCFLDGSHLLISRDAGASSAYDTIRSR